MQERSTRSKYILIRSTADIKIPEKEQDQVD